MSMVSARAWSYLVRLTFLQQMVSRKNLVALLLFILLASLVFLVAYWKSWNPTDFSQLIVLGLFGSFFVPVVALSYGTAVIGEAREGRTLVHLLARPISRGGIALGMYLSVVPRFEWPS